ncbi:MAG: M48 family metalloprotease [Acidobacteriota bacterium]
MSATPGFETVAVVKRLLLYLTIFALVMPPIFSASPATARARSQINENDPSIVLLNAVWERLLAVVSPPAGLAWPPQLRLLTDAEMVMAKMNPKDPNAFATPYKGTSLVCVNKALLNSIIEGNANRLAFILGHELSHITLGHVRPAGKTLLMMTVFSREQELAADRNGIKVALAAGYDFGEAMVGPKRFIELGLEVAPLWPSDHPSWTQRLALLEKNRASLWNSMGAFNNGVLFLTVEQYASAERCFASVVKAFPDCYEAHANLGYARLMEYCDLLRPEDVAEFGIGHIMIGGFYRRPDSLIEKGRGINAELWKQAVRALEEALRLKPDLSLAKASLGIAYLVRPEGKDVSKASRYLEEAAASAMKDNSLGAVSRAAVLVNLSVAELAAGRADLSDRHLGQAYRLAGSVAVIRGAILYNYAQALLQSGKENQKRDASDALYKYLKTASPASLWWRLGLNSYSKLCGAFGGTCETEQQIRASATQDFRPLPPVEVRPGIQIQLGDSIEEVQKRLGSATSIPIVREAKLNRYRYPKLGIDVIGTDQVIAISLNSRVAPALKLQAQGPGGHAKTLRVGMTQPQVAQVLGPTSFAATVFNTATSYSFYPQVGLAARFVQGRVAEWLVVILPRREG